MQMQQSQPRAPERSLAQRKQALDRANEIRSWRAELKRELGQGTRAVRPLLAEDVDDRLESMKVFELLLALPKWGRVKVNKVLTRVRISPSKTIGGLSERQRRELAMFLPSRIGGGPGRSL